MEMDLISPFEKFPYGNTHIYYLINYFSRHIYPHHTLGAGRDNVILSFDYYLWFTPKPYTVYIDVGTYFTSQKLCISF